MRIFTIGDIITPTTVDFIHKNLFQFRKANKIDFVVANGENASFLGGISRHGADLLFEGGVDAITGGNHTMQTKTAYELLDSDAPILRPINYPEDVPGMGYRILDCNGYKILLINALGNNMMEPTLDSPFPFIDRTLKKEEGQYDLSLMDFHGESTGEKTLVGLMYDGKFSAIWGTHTHIPTTDAQILMHGTGFISDIGASYPTGGVLGVETNVIKDRIRYKMPTTYKMATGPIVVQGVIFTIDEQTKNCQKIEMVNWQEGK